MVRRFLGLLLILVFDAQAETVLRRLQVHDLRTYGYHLGDQIERQITLELNHPYQLDRAVLPQTGRLDDWFELAGLAIQPSEIEGGQRYRLAARYQIMNLRNERQTLSIPALLLTARHGSQVFAFQVPPLVVDITAVSRMQLDDTTLQAAIAPQAIDVSSYRYTVLTASAVMLGAGLTWLGYVPGLRKRHQAFARAYRQLRLPGVSAAQARRIMHHAFDQTAGRTVFTRELPRLWEEHAWLLPQKTAIEAFFVDSENFFYQKNEGQAPLGTRDLIALCHACRGLERKR